MKILAIETSCDETSVAIIEGKGKLKNPSFEILSNVVLSQIKLHAHWGGVVPMMAKREHSKNLIVILEKSLRKSSFLISKSEFLISKQIQNSKLRIINKIRFQPRPDRYSDSVNFRRFDCRNKFQESFQQFRLSF